MAGALTREVISSLSVEDLCHYLVDQNQHADVVSAMQDNRITGKDFLELSQDQLKELFPILGTRMSVSRLVSVWTAVTDEQAPPLPQDQQPNIPPPLPSPGTSKARQSHSWVDVFTVPEIFSKATMKAIRDGVITKAARIEIISSLHTMMMQHKRYPKPAEYHAACGKLIEKHPLLADKTSSGFGTWKEQLKQKYRNGRRGDEDASEIALDTDSNPTDSNPAPTQHTIAKPKKKPRIGSKVSSEECGDHEELVKQLADELKNDTPQVAIVKRLLRKTFTGRRKWILEEGPTVAEVLGVYPLRKSSRLKRELITILDHPKDHDFLKDWSLWEHKIYEMAKIEALSRPTSNIKKLLDAYKDYTNESCGDDKDDNMEMIHCLHILTGFLSNKTKQKIVYEYPDNELKAIIQTLPLAPAIVVATSDTATQIFITAEKEILIESVDMAKALVDLISVYFTFDIAYPKPLYPVFIFLQHIVFGILDDQPQPNCVAILHTAMDKL